MDAEEVTPPGIIMSADTMRRIVTISVGTMHRTVIISAGITGTVGRISIITGDITDTDAPT